MGLRKLFGRRKARFGPRHKRRTSATAEDVYADCNENSGHVVQETPEEDARSAVSSLGHSVGSGGGRPRRRPIPVETVTTQEDDAAAPPAMPAKTIYMFPKEWGERTGSHCHGALYLDDESMSRKRRIFQNDDDDTWDTTVFVNEERYKRSSHRAPASWLATSLSCLACV